MKENLKSIHYSDGTPITGVYVYNNDENNAASYGRLYTWSAAMKGSTSSATNPSGIQWVCPNDWLLPSIGDWETLKNFVGSDAGAKLREMGTMHWSDPNNADNSTGFTGLPGGMRFGSGEYTGIGTSGNFWSATETDATFTKGLMLSNFNSDIINDISYLTSDKSNSNSVRCICYLTSAIIELTTYENSIYPNPTSGLVNIENLESNSFVTVFSLRFL